MAHRTDIDLSRFRTLLERRRQELLEREIATREAREPVELDQQQLGRLSRIDALQNQAMAQDAERRRKIELQRIDAALERIASGDYGYCLNCDEEIPLARLEFDPAVATCVECAK
jgi:RNA polymerase-binding transcription factor